jgi:hypothetical protein
MGTHALKLFQLLESHGPLPFDYSNYSKIFERIYAILHFRQIQVSLVF